MKKIIILTSLLLITHFIINAQFTTASNLKHSYVSNHNSSLNIPGNLIIPAFDSSQTVKDAQYYLEKSRNQKIGGYCFLGAGVIGLAIGLTSFPKNGDPIFGSQEDQSKANQAITITIIGSALMLGSIPFFVGSRVSKRKAKLFVNNEKTSLGIPVPAGSSITGMTLSIPLGK